MTKVTKKNSIIFNQMWVNKIIEERHMELLPSKRITNLSIGEYLEAVYLSKYSDGNDNPIKISKSNSLLLEQEWRAKFSEERMSIPALPPTSKLCLVELMEQKYNEKEAMEKNKIRIIEKCIQLND